MEFLDGFSIFDPKCIPSDESELACYGCDKLEIIFSQFGGPHSDVNVDECKSEWEGLKRLVHNTYSELSMRQVLHQLNTDCSLITLFPQLSKLANICALIPVSRAECERAFSSTNRIKTEL